MECAKTFDEVHGNMRRKDREIKNPEEIEAILNQGKSMYLALSDDNIPFLVPVFYTYNGKSIYFHSSRAGTKMEILKRNNAVCFAVSLDQGVIESEAACDFEAQHRTVVGTGTAVNVTDEQEKRNALDAIVARFTDRKFEYPEAQFRNTAVTRIDIHSIKGKKHGL